MEVGLQRGLQNCPLPTLGHWAIPRHPSRMGPLQCGLDEPETWETGGLGSQTALTVPDCMTWACQCLSAPQFPHLLRTAIPPRPQDCGENQMN